MEKPPENEETQSPLNQEEVIDHPTTTFFYGGFTKQSRIIDPKTGLPTGVIDEHALLRDARPRYPGHITHEYTLPQATEKELVHDGKFTTETGWDDLLPEVMERQINLARYGGINTFLFTVYGGVAKAGGNFHSLVEENMQLYTSIVKGNPEYHGMRAAPIICLSTPRNQLPIEVPHKAEDESYRHIFVNEESALSLSDYYLENYFSEHKEQYFTLDGRPVLMFFDLARIGVDQSHGFDVKTVANIFERIKELGVKKYGVEPYVVAVVNNQIQAVGSVTYPIDALTNYIDLPYFRLAQNMPIQEYGQLSNVRQREWEQIDELTKEKIPFVPALASGFDASSRVSPTGEGKTIKNEPYPDGVWYPLIPHVPYRTNTPELFGQYVEAGIKRTNNKKLPFTNFGPLNEMTEQSALIPFYDKETDTMNPVLIDTVKEKLRQKRISTTHEIVDTDFQSGRHARIEIRTIDKKDCVSKAFALTDPSILSTDLFDAYKEHRDEIGKMFRIPKLEKHDTSKHDSLEIIEELINGENVGHVMASLDEKTVRDACRAVIEPFTNNLLPPYVISEKFVSTHPSQVLYDLVPSNFILSDDKQTIPVDFYPPRLRDEKGLLCPVSSTLDTGETDYLTYLYGDLVPMFTRFIFETTKLRPESGLIVVDECIAIAREKLGDEFLRQLYLNAQKQKVRNGFMNIDGQEVLAVLDTLRP